MQSTQMHMRRFRHQTTSQMLYSDACRKRNQMQVFYQEWVKNWVLKLPWWHLSNLCWYGVCLPCYLHCLRQMNTVLNCFLCFVLVEYPQRVYILYLSWSDPFIISTGVSLPMLKYYVLSNAICQEVCKGSRTSSGKPLPDSSQILPPGEKCASYNKGVLIGLVTRYLF